MDLCRREGIKPGAFYAWTKDFMEARKEVGAAGPVHVLEASYPKELGDTISQPLYLPLHNPS